MLEDAVEYYQENDRDTIEQDAKKKVKETTEKVKKKAKKAKKAVVESELGEAVVDDMKALSDLVLGKLGDLNVKENFNNLVNTVSEANYLEIYQSMKDLGTLQKNGKDVEIVENIEIDGTPVKTEEGC